MRPGDGTTYGQQQQQQQQQQDAFSVVWRGYDREEVNRYFADREQSIRQLASQRDAARSRADELSRRLDRSQAQVLELSKKVDQLCKPPVQAHDLSERLDRMLKLANAEATEITSKAESEASDLRGKYERKIAELDEERKKLAAEHHSLLESTKRDAEQAAKEVERRRAQADAEAEQRIKQAEQASKANIERQDAASKAEAERVVREATETAKQRLDEANREVERLRALRVKISMQLSDVLGRIKQSGSLLEPLGDEHGNQKTAPAAAKTDKAEPVSIEQGQTAPGKDATRQPDQTGDGARGNGEQLDSQGNETKSDAAGEDEANTDGGPADAKRKTKTFAPVTPQ